MTRPAIDTGPTLPVTIQTPAHLDLDGPDDLRHGGNFAVAGCAGEPGANMHHVRKINMVGHPVNPDPGNRLLLVPVSLQLPDFQAHERMAGFDAGLHCGDSGNGRLGSEAVTEKARDGVVTCMEFMTECDRLAWRAVPKIQRQDVHERRKGGNNNSNYYQSADEP